MNAWVSLSIQMTKLAMESQLIILQRMARLHAGGAVGQREAARMVSEKVVAAATETYAMSLALASGKSPLSTLESGVKSYRKKVGANRRRLRRSATKSSQ